MNTWTMAWRLLDGPSRREAVVVLLVSVMAAQSAALMIGSVLPFLTVLSDPSRIESVPTLSAVRERLGLDSDYGLLVALGVGSICVIITSNVIQLLQTVIMTRFVHGQLHRLSHKLLKNYLQQPYEFFLNRHTGDMSTRVLAETQMAVEKFYQPATTVVASALTVFSIVGLLLWLDPFMALLAFVVFGGIYATVSLLCRKQLTQLSSLRAETNRRRYRIAGEALSGIKDIKLLGREETYLERFSRPSLKMARAQVKAALIAATPHYFIHMVAFGGVIVFCLLLVSPEAFGSGDQLGSIVPTLGVFAFAGQRLMPELGRIYRGVSDLRFAAASIEALYADLCIDGESADGDVGVPAAGLAFKGVLELSGVTYRYPGDTGSGVSDVTFSVQAGERIGIVGETGAGKTTLVDLVLGLFRPASGEIRINGVLLEGANLRDWQRQVAYVPQEIFLIDASVAENIALGVPPDEIDYGRIVQAAKIAQLDHFICEDLPLGYATAIGERGVRLSGGQRQRVGIARALYRDAPLIVFDEATSALDNLTEREVMAAIEALPGDRTVLMIAHRLSTVRTCDRIVVLERGHVIGVGHWDALMESNRAFRRMTMVA